MRYHFANQEKKKEVSRTRIAGVAFGFVMLAMFAIFVIAPMLKNLARGPQWLASAMVTSAETAVSAFTPKKLVLAQNAELKTTIQKINAIAQTLYRKWRG